MMAFGATHRERLLIESLESNENTSERRGRKHAKQPQILAILRY